MKYRFTIAAIALAAILYYWIQPMNPKPDYETVFDTRWTQGERLKWSVVLKGIRWKFPKAVHISTDSLAGLLSPSPDALPILLDVRAPEEYQISHLPGAIRAETLDEALAALEDTGSDRDVILYCSVGYRSSELAQKLNGEGFERLFNLEGGLFRWANEGRPLAQSEARVHPFDRLWGTLLDSSRTAIVD